MAMEVPLYQSMIDSLIHMIESSQLPEGKKLPSEAELGDIYGVSRITVRRALKELDDRGYIVKRHGVGSFVAHILTTDAIQIPGIINLRRVIRKMGKTPAIKLHDFQLIVDGSEPAIRATLAMSPDDYLYKITYETYADDELVGQSEWYLPFSRFDRIYVSELKNRQLLDLLLAKYEFMPRLVTEQTTDLATRAERRYFHTGNNGNDVLHVRVTGFEKDNAELYGELSFVGSITMYLFQED